MNTKRISLHEVHSTITLKVGDSIELGRFKNVSAKILDIKKDTHGQPVIVTNKGDKKALSFRLKKLEPKLKTIQGGQMVTAQELRQKHKELKRKAHEAEKVRQHARDWQTKEELVNLKKEKLIAKDKMKNKFENN